MELSLESLFRKLNWQISNENETSTDVSLFFNLDIGILDKMLFVTSRYNLKDS